jgi:D-alanyl-lipoteichoic acid acyltransferase DltB (MBOAT superfamily)
MLFNSYEFLFAFLPLTVLGFYLLGRYSRLWAFNWLIVASLFFYMWWRPFNVLLITPSILVNYVVARALQRLAADDTQQRAARWLLIGGLAFNVAFLGYFKYRNFFLGTVNDVLGTRLLLTQLILPLGISFITFQKIAFLIDVHAGRVSRFSLRDYCLFVLFFPQLIAGPIVHYREMMPQFQAAPCRFDPTGTAVALTLFAFGLFKKAFLADGIAPYVSTLYQQAAAGTALTLLPAWLAALGFTLQIYFDFSGYSDMALGLARLFGVRLPANFNSPLKASSIIDYWLRWHMTLTRFLTAYIYNPLALTLTRRRMAAGRPALAGERTTLAAFAALLVLPTVLTMLVSGLWHGAGYLFVLWGLVHGLYLAINHAWRLLAARLWRDRQRYQARMRGVGFVLTFLAVVGAMVLFRSPSLHAAHAIYVGMAGGHGLALPPSLIAHAGPLTGVLHRLGVGPDPLWDLSTLARVLAWTALLLGLALLAPSTLEILAPYEPALGWRPEQAGARSGRLRLAWRPSLLWALSIAALAAVAVAQLGGPSEFLYWQF